MAVFAPRGLLAIHRIASRGKRRREKYRHTLRHPFEKQPVIILSLIVAGIDCAYMRLSEVPFHDTNKVKEEDLKECPEEKHVPLGLHEEHSDQSPGEKVHHRLGGMGM
jgi:hypothetical protein